MEQDYLLIDQIAKHLDLTKRTIRYYEEQGLLKPATRTESGYRLYSEEDVGRLERILELRNTMGFSLKDIKEILTTEDKVLEMREAYHAGSSSEKKQALETMKLNLQRFLQLISQKRTHLEKIERAYQEKLGRLEKFLRELE